MKNLNESYVVELSTKEMKEINGGMPWLIPILIHAVIMAFMHPSKAY